VNQVSNIVEGNIGLPATSADEFPNVIPVPDIAESLLIDLSSEEYINVDCSISNTGGPGSFLSGYSYLSRGTDTSSDIIISGSTGTALGESIFGASMKTLDGGATYGYYGFGITRAISDELNAEALAHGSQNGPASPWFGAYLSLSYGIANNAVRIDELNGMKFYSPIVPPPVLGGPQELRPLPNIKIKKHVAEVELAYRMGYITRDQLRQYSPFLDKILPSLENKTREYATPSAYDTAVNGDHPLPESIYNQLRMLTRCLYTHGEGMTRTWPSGWSGVRFINSPEAYDLPSTHMCNIQYGITGDIGYAWGGWSSFVNRWPQAPNGTTVDEQVGQYDEKNLRVRQAGNDSGMGWLGAGAGFLRFPIFKYNGVDVGEVAPSWIDNAQHATVRKAGIYTVRSIIKLRGEHFDYSEKSWQLPKHVFDVRFALEQGLITRDEVRYYCPVLDQLLYHPAYPDRPYCSYSG